MSELDAERRERLVARVTRVGQVVVTTTDLAHVPDADGSGVVRLAVARRRRPRGGRRGVSAARRQPRPAGDAVRALADRIAPASTLGDVQRVWDGVVGEAVAAVATPTAEARGTPHGDVLERRLGAGARPHGDGSRGAPERRARGRADPRAAVPVGAREELVARPHVSASGVHGNRVQSGSKCAVLQGFRSDAGGRFDTRSCYPSVNHCRLPRPGRCLIPESGAFHVTRGPHGEEGQREQHDHESPRYDAEDITVLEGLEAVRKRPGMYIGSTGIRGLHHLVYEVVDNSVDEALAGHCSRVDVTIHPDNSVTVVDDGRGIPVGTMEKEGKPRPRGRAHRPARRRQVRRRRRLQGLRRPARRRRLGRQRALRGARGRRPDATASCTPSTTRAASRRTRIAKGDATKETGTTISFLPDADIFDETDFDFAILEQRLRETAFLTRGLRIALIDERGEGAKVEFHYEGGIEDFVRYLNENKEPIQKKVIFFEDEGEEGAVEVAMQWNGSYQESVFSFANNINTHEGGSHLSGFRSALTRTLNKYAREKGELKEKDENLSGEDVREGLTAVISAKLADPQFEGQTKTKLGNPGMQGFVESIVNTKLAEFLEENPQEARAVIRKAVQAAQARSAARKARDLTRRKSALENSTPAGQARRLLGQGPVARRDLRGRG